MEKQKNIDQGTDNTLANQTITPDKRELNELATESHELNDKALHTLISQCESLDNDALVAVAMQAPKLDKEALNKLAMEICKPRRNLASNKDLEKTSTYLSVVVSQASRMKKKSLQHLSQAYAPHFKNLNTEAWYEIQMKVKHIKCTHALLSLHENKNNFDLDTSAHLNETLINRSESMEDDELKRYLKTDEHQALSMKAVAALITKDDLLGPEELKILNDRRNKWHQTIYKEVETLKNPCTPEIQAKSREEIVHYVEAEMQILDVILKNTEKLKIRVEALSKTNAHADVRLANGDPRYEPIIKYVRQLESEAHEAKRALNSTSEKLARDVLVEIPKDPAWHGAMCKLASLKSTIEIAERAYKDNKIQQIDKLIRELCTKINDETWYRHADDTEYMNGQLNALENEKREIQDPATDPNAMYQRTENLKNFFHIDIETGDLAYEKTQEVSLVFGGTGMDAESLRETSKDTVKNMPGHEAWMTNNKTIIISGAMYENVGTPKGGSSLLALCFPDLTIAEKNLEQCIEIKDSKVVLDLNKMKNLFGDSIYIPVQLMDQKTLSLTELDMRGFSRGGIQAWLLSTYIDKLATTSSNDECTTNDDEVTTNDDEVTTKVDELTTTVNVVAVEPTTGKSWFTKMLGDSPPKIVRSNKFNYTTYYRLGSKSVWREIMSLNEWHNMPFMSQEKVPNTGCSGGSGTNEVEIWSHGVHSMDYSESHLEADKNYDDIVAQGPICSSIEAALGIASFPIRFTIWAARTTVLFNIPVYALGIPVTVVLLAASELYKLACGKSTETAPPGEVQHAKHERQPSQIREDVYRNGAACFIIPVALTLALSAVVLGGVIGAIRTAALYIFKTPSLLCLSQDRLDSERVNNKYTSITTPFFRDTSTTPKAIESHTGNDEERRMSV